MTIEVLLRFLPLAAAVLLAAVALMAAHGRRWWTAAVFVLGLAAIATAAWQRHYIEMRTNALAARLAGIAGTSAAAQADSSATIRRAGERLAEDAVRIKQLEEKIARLQHSGPGRMIDDKTGAALKNYLKWFAGHHVVVSCPPDDVEAFDYANQLVTILQDAGWDARGPETTQIFGEKPSMRIALYVNGGQTPEAAKILADAFRKYDIPYESRIPPSDTVPAPDNVELFVPPKSAPPEAASGSGQPRR